LKPSSSAAAAAVVVARVPARAAAVVALLHKVSRLLLQASLTPLRLVAVALVLQHHYKVQTEHLADLAVYWPCLVVVVVLVQIPLPPQLISLDLAPVTVAGMVVLQVVFRVIVLLQFFPNLWGIPFFTAPVIPTVHLSVEAVIPVAMPSVLPIRVVLVVGVLLKLVVLPVVLMVLAEAMALV
jgi:hypothetical protein